MLCVNELCADKVLCINLNNTTYRHDYRDRKRPCLVCREPDDRRIADLLEALNARAGATRAGLGCSRWTAPAPAGCTHGTRITPYAANTAEDDNSATVRYRGINACMADRPNRFLRTLWRLYPELYEQRLFEQQQQELAGNERQKQINRSRAFSTYQVDYGGMAEYPLLTYDCELERLRVRAARECKEFEEDREQPLDAESFGHWQARDRLKCIF